MLSLKALSQTFANLIATSQTLARVSGPRPKRSPESKGHDLKLEHEVMLIHRTLCECFLNLFYRIMLRQWEEARAITAQLLNSRDCMLLVDFDSHLDDITKDWTNQKLNAKIMELICPANGNM